MCITGFALYKIYSLYGIINNTLSSFYNFGYNASAETNERLNTVINNLTNIPSTINNGFNNVINNMCDYFFGPIEDLESLNSSQDSAIFSEDSSDSDADLIDTIDLIPNYNDDYFSDHRFVIIIWNYFNQSLNPEYSLQQAHENLHSLTINETYSNNMDNWNMIEVTNQIQDNIADNNSLIHQQTMINEDNSLILNNSINSSYFNDIDNNVYTSLINVMPWENINNYQYSINYINRLNQINQSEPLTIQLQNWIETRNNSTNVELLIDRITDLYLRIRFDAWIERYTLSNPSLPNIPPIHLQGYIQNMINIPSRRQFLGINIDFNTDFNMIDFIITYL